MHGHMMENCHSCFWVGLIAYVIVVGLLVAILVKVSKR